MKEIAETGYWNGETAHIHHVHCTELSKWICKFLEKEKDNLLADFACGLGNYLKDFSENGFTRIMGIDGDIPKQAVYPFILKHDLTLPLEVAFRGNVMSLECGEHIPAQYMNVYLDNITNACNGYLITSWAVRGQEGFGHVNCLDNHEIIPEIEKRGFTYLEKESESARSVIKDNTWWFKNTILIFNKNDIK